MKNLKKSFITMMLMLALVFALSACSSQDKEETVKVLNKTGFDISMNNHKIKKDKSYEIKVKEDKKTYKLKISYQDGDIKELGSVKLGDIKSKIEIKYEDGVTFMEYETKKGKKVSTKEKELKVKIEAEAATSTPATENTQATRQQTVAAGNNQSSTSKNTAPANTQKNQRPAGGNSGAAKNNDNCVDPDDPNNYN